MVGGGGDDRLHVGQEAQVEHLVGLVNDQDAELVELEVALAQVVEDPARGADHDLGALVQGDDLGAERAPADDRDRPHAGVTAGGVDVARDLEAELTGGDEDQGLHLGQVRVDLLDDRDAEGERLAGPGAGLADEVDAGQRERQAERLDGERVLDPDPGQRGQRGRGGA
jgi:hypothetical protein